MLLHIHFNIINNLHVTDVNHLATEALQINPFVSHIAMWDHATQFFFASPLIIRMKFSKISECLVNTLVHMYPKAYYYNYCICNSLGTLLVFKNTWIYNKIKSHTITETTVPCRSIGKTPHDKSCKFTQVKHFILLTNAWEISLHQIEQKSRFMVNFHHQKLAISLLFSSLVQNVWLLYA